MQLSNDKMKAHFEEAIDRESKAHAKALEKAHETNAKEVQDLTNSYESKLAALQQRLEQNGDDQSKLARRHGADMEGMKRQHELERAAWGRKVAELERKLDALETANNAILDDKDNETNELNKLKSWLAKDAAEISLDDEYVEGKDDVASSPGNASNAATSFFNDKPAYVRAVKALKEVYEQT
jgi:chromosome segregation ATPase